MNEIAHKNNRCSAPLSGLQGGFYSQGSSQRMKECEIKGLGF